MIKGSLAEGIINTVSSTGHANRIAPKLCSDKSTTCNGTLVKMEKKKHHVIQLLRKGFVCMSCDRIADDRMCVENNCGSPEILTQC